MVEGLLASRMLIMTEFDPHLAKSMVAGPRAVLAQELAIHLVQLGVQSDAVVSIGDFKVVTEYLAHMARSSNNAGVLDLVDQARQAAARRAAADVAGAAAGGIPVLAKRDTVSKQDPPDVRLCPCLLSA